MPIRQRRRREAAHGNLAKRKPREKTRNGMELSPMHWPPVPTKQLTERSDAAAR